MDIILNIILALFSYVLYCSIIATIIGMIILLLRKKLKKKLSPKANYMVWIIFLIALIYPISIPSNVSIYNIVNVENVKHVRIGKRNNLINSLNNDVTIDDTKVNIATNNYNIWKNYIGCVIAFAWFINTIIKSKKLISSYIAIGKLAEIRGTIDKRANWVLEDCKKKLNIKRNIKVIKQNAFKKVSTIGVFKVKILVTKELLELDDDSLKDIFMHELSHYKRKDNIVNFMIVVFKGIYWFNPFLIKIFKEIRDDMEYATDELAINKMNTDEKIHYCTVLACVSAMEGNNNDNLLGLADEVKPIEKRVNVISLKPEYEKNAKIITVCTSVIILFICLLFYPTSYGKVGIPRLYIKSENGDIVEAVCKENKFNEIVIQRDTKIELITDKNNSNNYIFYSKVDENTLKNKEGKINITDNKVSHLDNLEESIYKFTLTYGKNKNIEYYAKIIVK